MTSNELRPKMGMPPSDDPRADELNNANMPDYDMMNQNGGEMMPQEDMSYEQEPEAEPAMEVQESEEVYFDPSANGSSEYGTRTFSLFK